LYTVLPDLHERGEYKEHISLFIHNIFCFWSFVHSKPWMSSPILFPSDPRAFGTHGASWHAFPEKCTKAGAQTAQPLANRVGGFGVDVLNGRVVGTA
jgi:hypothetical protein